MNARQLGLFGLAALGLALTAPVHAAPDIMESTVIVAQRDRGEPTDARRQDRRDTRQDDRRDTRRDAGREETRGYGYGYERRQQQRFEDDGRPRDRR